MAVLLDIRFHLLEMLSNSAQSVGTLVKSEIMSKDAKVQSGSNTLLFNLT